jgi:hypothetical protein
VIGRVRSYGGEVPRRILPVVAGLAAAWFGPRAWCGRDAEGWYAGEPDLQRGLANELVAFEAADSHTRAEGDNRFAGEWALVTHQMVALGLAQLCLAHPEWRAELAPVAKVAALRSFLPEMRDFGTLAWKGEDALSPAALAGPHGHAYLAYSALAVGMAALVDPTPLPPDVQAGYDALVDAYARKVAVSPTGLIETYPGEAYPTDVAAVAGAIAVHDRVTGTDHRAALTAWAAGLRAHQLDPASGLVLQRLSPRTGEPHDAPRASGTGLAAYFAGFADRSVAVQLTDAIVAQHLQASPQDQQGPNRPKVLQPWQGSRHSIVALHGPNPCSISREIEPEESKEMHTSMVSLVFMPGMTASMCQPLRLARIHV